MKYKSTWDCRLRSIRPVLDVQVYIFRTADTFCSELCQADVMTALPLFSVVCKAVAHLNAEEIRNNFFELCWTDGQINMLMKMDGKN